MLRSTLYTVASFALANSVAGQLSSSAVTASASESFASGTTTVKIWEAGPTTLGAEGLAGSIINVNAVATTILISCDESDLTGTAVSDCGDAAYTLTVGPSTFHWAITTAGEVEGVPVTITIEQDCQITSSATKATCGVTEVVRASADGQSTSTTTSTTSTFTGSQIFYDDLVITAGADKLSSPQATQTPGAAALVAPPMPTGALGLGVGGMAAAAVVAVAGLL